MITSTQISLVCINKYLTPKPASGFQMSYRKRLFGVIVLIYAIDSNLIPKLHGRVFERMRYPFTHAGLSMVIVFSSFSKFQDHAASLGTVIGTLVIRTEEQLAKTHLSISFAIVWVWVRVRQKIDDWCNSYRI